MKVEIDVRYSNLREMHETLTEVLDTDFGQDLPYNQSHKLCQLLRLLETLKEAATPPKRSTSADQDLKSRP